MLDHNGTGQESGDKRTQWKGRLEFLFTEFGYIIGMGNIWRFPYICYTNGGGAFLIPYMISLVMCTLPMLFLEITLGQFSSESAISVWNICPLMSGVGWATVFNCFMTSVYYIVVIMYAVYYMLVAFVNIGDELPWQRCRESDRWSTELCLSESSPGIIHATSNNNSLHRSPEDEYWNNHVLGVGQGGDQGDFVGRNVALLAIMWLVVYYCCIRGIKSIARVIYVTVTFPIVLYLLLLIRGVTLQGHGEGIRFYFQPSWDKLSDMTIWSNAATQAMYNMGLAFGAHISMASRNKFRNNIVRDTVVIALVDTGTSIVGGFIVFAFLGHVSYRLNRPIDYMFSRGPGILYVSYAEGLSLLPGASTWAFFFYLAVFTLGIDSQFVFLWAIVTSIQDALPQYFRDNKRRRTLFLIAICILLFCLGLPLVTKGGIYFVLILDKYTSQFTFTVIILLKAFTICWVYGVKRYIADVEMMLGRKSWYFWSYWLFTWSVTTPLFCVFIGIATVISYRPISYGDHEVTPGYEVIGWLLTVTPFIIILAVGTAQVRKHGGIRAAAQPSACWGPRLKKDRTGRYFNDHPVSQINIQAPEPCSVITNGLPNGGYLTATPRPQPVLPAKLPAPCGVVCDDIRTSYKSNSV